MPQQAGKLLDRRRILIVEDEYFLADDLRKALEAQGASVIGPFSTIKNAERAIQDADPDCAVLDLNLQGEFSYELSRRLRDRAIPLVFVSGYDGAVVPSDLAGIPHLTKPVHVGKLIGLIARPEAERPA